MIYDAIDPEKYEKRYELCPREAYLHRHWNPLICKIIRKYSKGKIALDVGCGTGVYTEEISKNSQICIGLDLSKNMVKYAKEKRKELNIIIADACELPFKDESFDFLVSIGLLEYVPKNVVMKEMNRVMKSMAFLVISVTNKYSAFRSPFKALSKIFGKEYIKKEPSFKEMLHTFVLHHFKLIWYKMDDGLIFLPDFLDRIIGENVYRLIEKIFKKVLRRNPFSHVMLFLLQKI